MLKIYGIPRSRAFRTLWMAKELGLDYENVAIDMGKGETRTPEYLAINPNGHIPAIDDDGFVLWESMAINLYLAKKHARGSLYPIRFEDEARTWQWSFWGMTEVERPVLTAMFHRALLPEDKRDRGAGRPVRARTRPAADGARPGGRGPALPARRAFHRRRFERREHPVLGAAGADRCLARAEGGGLDEALRRTPRRARRPRSAALKRRSPRWRRRSRKPSCMSRIAAIRASRCWRSTAPRAT